MQAILTIECEHCKKSLGNVNVDTADMPEQLQEKVNQVILAHRGSCKYYLYAESEWFPVLLLEKEPSERP